MSEVLHRLATKEAVDALTAALEALPNATQEAADNANEAAEECEKTANEMQNISHMQPVNFHRVDGKAIDNSGTVVSNSNWAYSEYEIRDEDEFYVTGRRNGSGATDIGLYVFLNASKQVVSHESDLSGNTTYGPTKATVPTGAKYIIANGRKIDDWSSGIFVASQFLVNEQIVMNQGYNTDAMIYSMAQSSNEADYVNVDLVEKTLTFGSGTTGAGRVYLRHRDKLYNIGGRSVDFSSEYLSGKPWCFFYYCVSKDEFVVTDVMKATDADCIYIGSIWGFHPSVNLNVVPFYYVNGAKTYRDDVRGTFDATRSYGYAAYNMAVLGDSTSTYAEISEDTIGGRTVRGAYYPNSDVNSSDKMWWAILQKMLRFGGVINVSAISRSRYQDDIDAGGIYAPAVWNEERIARLHKDGKYCHYIFINAGINDGFSTNKFGEFSYSNDEDAIEAEAETIARGVELTLVRVIQENPYARIVLMIPYAVKQNTADYVWKSYYKACELIKQIGEAYGVHKIVDLRKCGIHEGNHNEFTIDGVHPNAMGMKMIAGYIYNCITDDEQPVKLA